MEGGDGGGEVEIAKDAEGSKRERVGAKSPVVNAPVLLQCPSLSITHTSTITTTTTMAVPRSRILDLMRVQCRIFNTTFNPTNTRLGNKVLRQRLRGPSIAAYYPRRVSTFKQLRQLYPGVEIYDNFEEDRLEHIQIAKSRGKGAPKKKKTAAGKYSKIRSARAAD